MHHPVANFLQCTSAKNFEKLLRVDKEETPRTATAATSGNLACHVAESARCYCHWETNCHRARGWRHQLVCEVHVRYQRPAFTMHVHTTSAAGLSVSRRNAASAWWGFSTSADRQRIETFLRRAAQSGLWESATTAEELVNDADERLFWKVRHCAHHVLDELLPPKSDAQHNLRKRVTTS